MTVVFHILRKSNDPKYIVIVVSPLVVLMKDQVTSLMSKGLKGVYVTSENVDEYMKDVFFSPEILLCNDSVRDMLQTPVYQENVIALVVDETHLVKKY